MTIALIVAAALQTPALEDFIAHRTIFAECVKMPTKKARQSGASNQQFGVLYDEGCVAEREAFDKAALAALLQRNGGDLAAANARLKSGTAHVRRHYLEAYAAGETDPEYPLYAAPAPPKPS
jgi:hypothetical protein